jgi:hypothetical protein
MSEQASYPNPVETSWKGKPPLDIEPALDLIIAAAAHTSARPAHAEFGAKLIDEYLVKLRERYQDDPVASRYLDNLCTVIAWAIRGLAVERQRFETQRKALESVQEIESKHLQGLMAYSPLNKEGIFHKALWALASGGLSMGGLLISGQSTGISVLVALGLAALLSIITDWWLSARQAKKLRELKQMEPSRIDEAWMKPLEQYRKIAKGFLLSAIRIREEFYPHLTTLNGQRVFETYTIPHVQFSEKAIEGTQTDWEPLLQEIERIVERHFSFP